VEQGTPTSRKGESAEEAGLAVGPVVALKRGNARRAKGPCRWHSEAGERGRRGMTIPTVNLQELQARIGSRAKSAPTHRFWGIYVHVCKIETLETSYRVAKGNRGAPGVDGVTFDQVEASGRQQFLEELSEQLRAGTYRALPYRKVEIPKSNGKTRTISIAALRDRVVQGAMKLVIEPIFEADFSDSSMGGRPGRRAHQALARVQKALMQRKHRVVDLDLAAFFDNITHHVLLAKLARRIDDPRMLESLKWFLKGAGKRGVPQGSPLSPLLANLALNDLDHILDRGAGQITYVRYLDDMVVMAHDSPKGRLWAARALDRIKIEACAIGVSINEEKTRVVSLGDTHATFAFLGFDWRWSRSRRTGKHFALKTPRKKKVQDVCHRVAEVLDRNRHLEVTAAVALINPVLRGWANYFRAGNAGRAMQQVRRYVELRVRRFAARQRKRPGFGWKRWSKEVVYVQWGLYDSWHVDFSLLKVALASRGTITPT
jgi:RNA-directed DNA polymerase